MTDEWHNINNIQSQYKKFNKNPPKNVPIDTITLRFQISTSYQNREELIGLVMVFIERNNNHTHLYITSYVYIAYCVHTRQTYK